MNNILPIFVSCEKYKDRVQRIHEMCSVIGIKDYIIFKGGSYFRKIDSHLVQLDCGDNYEDLPEKMFKIYKYLISFNYYNKYKFFWKIDDDVDISNFTEEDFEILNKKIRGDNYCGFKVCEKGKRGWHMEKCSEHSDWNKKRYEGEYLPWAEGGSTYILSSETLLLFNDFYDFTELSNTEIFEDLAVAKFLNEKRVYPTLIPPWRKKLIETNIYK